MKPSTSSMKTEAVQSQMAWESYYSALPGIPERMKRLAPFLVEALPSFKQRGFNEVLDLGCGAGRHCVFLAEQGFSVVGVDASASALGLAKSWAHRQRMKRATFIRATMTDLPLRDNTFDAIISISVIHHAIKKDILKTLKEVRRVLVKSGELLTNLTSVKDPRYGEGEKVEPRTFRTWEAFEEKRFKELHHYFTRREVTNLMACFTSAKIETFKEKPNYWKITAIK